MTREGGKWGGGAKTGDERKVKQDICTCNIYLEEISQYFNFLV